MTSVLGDFVPQNCPYRLEHEIAGVLDEEQLKILKAAINTRHIIDEYKAEEEHYKLLSEQAEHMAPEDYYEDYDAEKDMI